jgi:hypothetical protein
MVFYFGVSNPGPSFKEAHMPIDWTEIKSRKIRDAFRTALSDDKQLSHSEVVEVLRSALDDGNLSGEEISDLNKVAKTSETILPRSKHMLVNLAFEAFQVSAYGPINFSTSRQKYAADILCDFLKRMGQPYFSRLDRDRVGIDLLLRVSNPNIINQKNTTLCGPVSFLYSLAFDSPAAYAKFGIDLYEKGKARIGRIEIEPSSDCRSYFPLPPISHGEWLTAGSLRDSENFFFDYDSVEASGSSSNDEMARWFERAGYTDVQYEDNIVMSRGAGDISLVNKYYNAGYRVLLRINSKLLYKESQADSSHRGNHFVVLRSPISVFGQTAVRLTVYTWGTGQRNIPAEGTQLSPGGFLEHWYGYVAAKPF